MVVKTALVVDDSKSARLLLQKTLEKFHIQTDACASVKEALALLDHKQPDIIFVDYVMNEVNGLEAIPLIKQKKSCATIPIVMCSSQEDTEYRTQSIAAGAVDFLPKPCSPRHLAYVLQKISPNFSTKNNLPSSTTSAFNLEENPLDPSLHETFRKLSQAKKELSHNKLQTILDERLSHLRRVLLLEIESSVENTLHKTLKQFEQHVDDTIEKHITTYMNTMATAFSESTLNQIVFEKLELFKTEITQLLDESLKAIKSSIIENSASPSKKLLTDVKHLARFTASHHAATSAEKIARESASAIARTISTEQLNEVSEKTIEMMTDQLQPKMKLTQRLSLGAVIISAAALVIMILAMAHRSF